MNYKSIIIKRANNAKAIDKIVAALTNSSENPARAQKDAVYAVYGFLTAREAPEQFSEEDKQKYIDMTDKIIPYRRSGQAATEYWFNVQEKSDYFRTPNRAWIEWKGVNKDSHVNDKNNLKMYVTIPNPLANYGFVEHIPELTNMLSDMAGEEWIALKFPAHPSVLASHNDNVIVYFQNPELKNTISGIVNQWLDTIKIPKGERLHGRSEFGEDPAGTSWTKGIAREVVSEIFSQWDPETGNEQTARGLAEQALRKAVEKSRAQQDRIASYRSLIIRTAQKQRQVQMQTQRDPSVFVQLTRNPQAIVDHWGHDDLTPAMINRVSKHFDGRIPIQIPDNIAQDIIAKFNNNENYQSKYSLLNVMENLSHANGQLAKYAPKAKEDLEKWSRKLQLKRDVKKDEINKRRRV